MSYSLSNHTLLNVLLKPHCSLRNNAETKDSFFSVSVLFEKEMLGNNRRIRKYLLKKLIF